MNKHPNPSNQDTHACCNTRLKLEGGKAQCCYCMPHQPCDLYDSQSDHYEHHIETDSLPLWCRDCDVAVTVQDDYELRKNIGLMRQWLNEDRIRDAKRFVTNEMLEHWLMSSKGGDSNVNGKIAGTGA